MQLELPWLGGFIYSETVFADLKLVNRSPAPVTIESATLVMNGHTYVGKFDEKTERTAGAGETKSIDAKWDLGREIRYALGDTATLIVELRVGGRKQTVSIPYARSASK